jgi:hypothetical protein
LDRAVFPSLSLWERGRVRIPAVSPIYGVVLRLPQLV